MVLYGNSAANHDGQPRDGRYLAPDGAGAGGFRPPPSAPDRPPNRQADVRVPQGLQRLQIPDGRGVTPSRGGRSPSKRKRKRGKRRWPRPLQLRNSKRPPRSAVDSTAPTPETPAESPYPGENTYPDLAADATRPEEVQPEATQPEDLTASAVEAARLRIQPPSTGAVVAANPPGQPAQQAELFELSAEPVAESTAAPTPEDAATTPASDNPVAERSEPAAHHG